MFVMTNMISHSESCAAASRLFGFSRVEAIRLGDRFVGTEHMLLGILSDTECTAFQILKNLGVDERALSATVESMREPVRSRGPYANAVTFRAMLAIDLAVDEALRRDAPLGSEHVLIGILREGGGIAVRSLREHGVYLDDVLLEAELTEALAPVPSLLSSLAVSGNR